MIHDGFHGWRGFVHHPSITASASAQGRREQGGDLYGKCQQTAWALMMGTSLFCGGLFPLAAAQGSPKSWDKAGLPKPSQCASSNRAKKEFSGCKDETRDRQTTPAGCLSTSTNPKVQLACTSPKGVSPPLSSPQLPPFPLHQQLSPSPQHLPCADAARAGSASSRLQLPPAALVHDDFL